MKLLLLLSILLFSLKTFALNIEAKYKITYGDFLELGIATATLKVEKQDYEIRIEAKTTGMAKLLTKNRVEIYESSGKLLDNDFIPNIFIKTRSNDTKKRVKTYTFDHSNKKVFLNTKTKGEKSFINKGLKASTKEYSKESNEEFDYFAKDDLLSLFFDMNKKLNSFEKDKKYSFKAIGANKKTGEIDIISSSHINKELIVYINQKIFSSKKGELLISLNKEGFCKKAILKDVLFFGDIVGNMIEFKTNKGDS